MRKISIIGTGYVGLVSGAGISEFGHNVICADVDYQKIKSLKNGVVQIHEPGLDELVKRNLDARRLSFTENIDNAIRQSEIIFIAVGTPQAEDGQADLSAVEAVSKTIGKNLNSYKIVSTKSTVPVGTGNLICNIISSYKNKQENFDYVSNPEFLREGSAVKDFLWPDRVVIGSESDKAFGVMQDIYRPLYINETPILHTNVQTAEMIKYASNAFLALKISYINEIANLCEEVGADVHQVSKGMGMDGRISSKFLHPGPGYGGSCFPKDTFAIAKLSQKHGVRLNTVEATIKTNLFQKKRMVKKLKDLIGGTFFNNTIAVLGLSFKPNTDDVRDSSSIIMIQSIIDQGGKVNAYDPVSNAKMQKYFPSINYFNSWIDACHEVDGTVIMTDWNEFRGMDIGELKLRVKNPVILDTRNILSTEQLLFHGFKFSNVGRKLFDNKKN